MKTEENGQINRDKEFVRGSPKCLKKKSVIFPEKISCSTLLCFSSGLLPQRMLMEKPCQHGPLFQKTKKKK